MIIDIFFFRMGVGRKSRRLKLEERRFLRSGNIIVTHICLFYKGCVSVAFPYGCHNESVTSDNRSQNAQELHHRDSWDVFRDQQALKKELEELSSMTTSITCVFIKQNFSDPRINTNAENRVPELNPCISREIVHSTFKNAV